jgi:adenylate kinase family enzyme
VVYGVTGSGKTTLAREISERTGLPWYAVDDMTWEPGWVAVPAEEQRRRIAAVCAKDEWILDHGYSSWIDIVLARVELIVALDYPRWLSLGRLILRTLRRNLDHKPICNGNTESLRQTFSRDSIIAWHFRSFARKRVQMRSWAADPPSGIRVVRLASPAATRHWLASLGSAAAGDRGDGCDVGMAGR